MPKQEKASMGARGFEFYFWLTNATHFDKKRDDNNNMQ
jgi:hypothetical protein